MPTQQSAVPFTQELLALLDCNSFEIGVSLLDDDLPQQTQPLSDIARKALETEQAVVDECFDRKQYPWAIDAQQNALKILEDHLGLLNLETLECLRDLGNLYVRDKKHEEARKCFLRAWRIAQSVLPPKHKFLKSVGALYQECLIDIEKSQPVVNLHMHMAKIIAASHEPESEEGIHQIQTPSDLDAALKQAQEHLTSASYKEAARLLQLGAKFLCRVTMPQPRYKLKWVYELWADALQGLGQTNSAYRTRLLAQKMAVDDLKGLV